MSIEAITASNLIADMSPLSRQVSAGQVAEDFDMALWEMLVQQLNVMGGLATDNGAAKPMLETIFNQHLAMLLASQFSFQHNDTSQGVEGEVP